MESVNCVLLILGVLHSLKASRSEMAREHEPAARNTCKVPNGEKRKQAELLYGQRVANRKKRGSGF